jgi:two-component system nitrate/nitrite sensor histidine kinase NarX
VIGLNKLAMLNRGALAEMRTLLLELRPAALAETSLSISLAHLVDSLRIRTDCPLTLSVAAEGVHLPERVQISFYRIAQEALNNAVKHSRARQIDVMLSADAHITMLHIHDDGIGFDKHAIAASHFGVRMMQERALESGIELTIVSSREGGTDVTALWRGERDE